MKVLRRRDALLECKKLFRQDPAKELWAGIVANNLRDPDERGERGGERPKNTEKSFLKRGFVTAKAVGAGYEELAVTLLFPPLSL